MRRILVAVGLAFVALTALTAAGLGYVGYLAASSADTNKETAIELVHEVSQTWSIDQVQDVFAPSALAQASTPAGRGALAVMSRLGQLRSTDNVRQTGFHIDLVVGTKVRVAFDGRFDHGTGKVAVVVEVVEGRARIVELDLTNIRIWKKRQRRVAV